MLHGFSFANYLAELGPKAQQEIYEKSSIDLALEDAFRKMRAFLMTTKGLTEDEAISLMSVARRLRRHPGGRRQLGRPRHYQEEPVRSAPRCDAHPEAVAETGSGGGRREQDHHQRHYRTGLPAGRELQIRRADPVAIDAEKVFRHRGRGTFSRLFFCLARCQPGCDGHHDDRSAAGAAVSDDLVQHIRALAGGASFPCRRTWLASRRGLMVGLPTAAMFRLARGLEPPQPSVPADAPAGVFLCRGP